MRSGRCVWLAMFALSACGDDPELLIPDDEVCLDRADGARYCIDVYEASREDATETSAGGRDDGRARSLANRVPWTDLGWAAARGACEAAGKRLCASDEWVDACDGTPGDGGARYTYGDDVQASQCNTLGFGVEATGTSTACTSGAGTFDQSGNLWEWSGTTQGSAAARGGGWRSTQTHRCVDTLPGAPTVDGSGEIGFRCCRDA